MSNRRSAQRQHTGDIFGGKKIKDWLNDNRRPEGMNQRGKGFYLELKDILVRFSRNAVILYFMITRYGMNDFRTMQKSTRKQKKYIYRIMMELKGYDDADGKHHDAHAVTKEWETVFRRDIERLHKRADHIFFIIQQDLKETELYPYFEAVGFDRLMDFSMKYAAGDDEQAEQLEAEIEEWNACHQEEVAAHMEKMAEQIRNRDAHRQKMKEIEQADKAARRAARALANAEVREIKKNAQAHRTRDRYLGIAGSRYWYR